LLLQDKHHSYSHLPTTEEPSAVTVKSSGQERFCKKCQCRKPDRTHHCSTCRTCVLKMDHHCPWLANCLGHYNYKAFLLFLIYTSVFCIVCFVVSSIYVYEELFASGGNKYPVDDFTPVNWVLLAVVSGIIGLVLSGFTIWHLTLVAAGMTTIESLEKVRYNSPGLSRHGPSPPRDAHRLYNDPAYAEEQERIDAYNRYNSYIMEETSKKLPHAFDLGRSKNFEQVFGAREEWYKWFIPVFSGIGDGWHWETSSEWKLAVEAMKEERDRILREQGERERRAGWGIDSYADTNYKGANPNGLVRNASSGAPLKQSKAERILGKVPGTYSDNDHHGGEGVPLKRIRPADETDLSSDDSSSEDLEQGTHPKNSWASWSNSAMEESVDKWV
jgi:palmitoyltransferase ZDHHC2/15/20